MKWNKEQIEKSAEEAFECSECFTSLPEKRILENLAMALDAVVRLLVSKGWDSFPTVTRGDARSNNGID